MDVADDADTMDVLGAIEETMHTILDYGGNADDLRTTMGLVPETEIDSDIIESGEYVPVDLGYCLDGQLTGFEVLPLDECDTKDALNEHQIENVMTAFNNLSVNLRLPAAKVLSQGGYTEWQAYQICKAFEVGVDADVIGEHIANPVLNMPRCASFAASPCIPTSPTTTQAPIKRMSSRRSRTVSTPPSIYIRPVSL